MSQSLTIHQFHSRATAGDAVTRHMFFIQDSLGERGINGKIFAAERKNLAQGKVQPWSLDSAWNCDLLLIHHSQFNPNLKELLDLEIPKVFVYHSQPPEKYFSHDPEIKNQLKKSRHQLSLIRKANIPVVAVSHFAAQELVRLGFGEPELIPLLHLEKASKRSFGEDSSDSKNILFVGKLASHKRQSLLIESFYHLKKLLPAHSKLILVGTGDPLYSKYLKLLIKQWKLSDSVVIAGKVTDQDLNHYYEMADAFVCLSEHEGFCIPVVEAMKAGAPVFFRPLAGVKETMGEAGVQILSCDPMEIAAVIQGFLENPIALRRVIEKQDLRIEELSQFQNQSKVVRVLSEFCQRSEPISLPLRKEIISNDATIPW